MLRVLILFVAIFSAGLAGWLTFTMQSSSAPALAAIEPEAEAEPRMETEEVLTVSADLGRGETLDESNLRWQPWPAEALNPNFITRAVQPDAIAELVGSVVRSQLGFGEPLRPEKLANAAAGFLSAVLPQGMRAVGIRISTESTAGGFILPDDRVDVIHTLTRSGAEGQPQNVSQTILSNIRVLAIDQRVEERGGDVVALGKTATLELTPQQAEILSGAQASGLLSLALRSVADNGEASASLEPVAVPEETGRTIRILRAGRTQFVRTQDADGPSS